MLSDRVASKLVVKDQCEVDEVFQAMTSILFSALMAFVAFSFDLHHVTI